MTKDYSYLEGKEFTYNTGAEKLPAKVLYADYHVGLTCVNLYNPDFYIVCLRGPVSPGANNLSKKAYQAIWFSLITQIEHGYVEARRVCQTHNKHTNREHSRSTTPAQEDCAFGQ